MGKTRYFSITNLTVTVKKSIVRPFFGGAIKKIFSNCLASNS